MKKFYFIPALFILLVFSCTKRNFEVNNFNPFCNFKTINDTLVLPMDLKNAVVNGIVLPSVDQYPSGYFRLSFEIKNKSDRPKAFYYKIFYQNESYKYSEYYVKLDSILYNRQAGYNFYGSWENASDGFHITPVIPNDDKTYLIVDSFRIAGNPRDEQKYFGSNTPNSYFNKDTIKKKTIDITYTPEWIAQIKEKAKKNNISVEEQLYVDALWVVNSNSKKGNFNNRWKRNPRVGNYSFILAVAPSENMNSISRTIKNISQENKGEFVNPYYSLFYDKYQTSKKLLKVIRSNSILKTSASFNLGSGLYIDGMRYVKFNFDSSYFSKNCGSSYKIFQTAQFEQFFHNINKNFKIKNIPVSYDVVSDNYSQNEYNANALKYKLNELIEDFVHITDYPGKTVESDEKTNCLIMSNPGGNIKKKENVGITSRIGFTYGKFIAKIKFPAIINCSNVWNGLTCAYWLKFQDEGDWNQRSPSKSGYLAVEDNGPKSRKVSSTYYSEIDFEILKTSQYWPQTSYGNLSNYPKDDPKSNHDIIVTCTNWDMGCKDAANFIVGAQDFIIGGKHFTLHRWDHWNKTVTLKAPVNHDSLFNRPCYYEIDWQPNRIIWRIGTSLNNMTEIGYMDNTVTNIPDNQMVAVFSQEFHSSVWWPLSPFIQDLIPFPKNDIKGEILEFRVE
jgi:hypothetical protein